MQNNFVAYADANVVQYTTSTLPGSSGSPVLDDEYKVVAIDHSGGMLVEAGTKQPYLRNAGTSAIAVLRICRQTHRKFMVICKGSWAMAISNHSIQKLKDWTQEKYRILD